LSKTKIEWAEHSWNPTRGCSRVSEGCRNCYAEAMAARFSGPGKPFENFAQIGRVIVTDGQQSHTTPYRWTGKVELIPSMLDIPLRRRKPTTWSVNSMSDLFHEALPDEAIDRVFAAMALCPQHTFQVLTKRAGRMLHYLKRLDVIRNPGHQGKTWGTWEPVWEDFTDQTRWLYGKPWPLPNVWLGVSAENHETAAARIPLLLQTPAAVRFVSYEPALGPMDFSRWLRGLCPQCHGFNDYCADVALCETCKGLNGIGLDWIIVGGESGPGARPFDLAWARSAIEQCRAAGVSCFVKQLGTAPEQACNGKHCGGCKCPHAVELKSSKGGDMAEWPADLRIREMPEKLR